MTSAPDARDDQADRRQAIAQRFIESAEQHPDVTKAARREAENAVRLEDRTSF